jgi:hypothetical protein
MTVILRLRFVIPDDNVLVAAWALNNVPIGGGLGVMNGKGLLALGTGHLDGLNPKRGF